MPVTTLAASWTAKLAARALTSEGMLGVAGCAIACASGSFALYMHAHAPALTQPTSGYFSVFTQLSQGGRVVQAAAGIKPALATVDEIDPVVTGSIPPRPVARTEGERAILPNMLLRQIDGTNALVEVNDSLAVYKIGDLIPGAGRLMAMTRQDGRPALETSRGLIIESR